MTVYKNPLLFFLFASYFLSSCAYMQSVTKQSEVAEKQTISPGQHNLKHLIDRDTLIVYGKIITGPGNSTNQSLSVAAYSDRFTPHELVDITHYASTGRHYVLNLPAGKYDLLVFTDSNNNKRLEQSEVTGRRIAILNETTNSAKVLTGFDIKLSEESTISWNVDIPVPDLPEIKNSLVFPKGAIRKLNDPVFGKALSTLGMYEPAEFMERAPTIFYTLEEYIPYKIPVIFIHGIGGTVQDFAPVIDKMDREYYAPWFFYYPSGSDLNVLSENFYKLFLSGELFPRTGPPVIIVAYSMGGLIAREALNLVQNSKTENSVALLITIATPFGGHPEAVSWMDMGPMVLPSWRNLNPDSLFISQLFRKPLPASVNHQLLYAYNNPDTLKLGENSDGAVPLYSQLHPVAQIQSERNIGIDSSHAGILNNERSVNHIINSFNSVDGIYPLSHVRAMQAGGFNIEPGDNYSNREKYAIKVLGKYLEALSNGNLAANTTFQKHFVEVSQGKAKAKHFTEKAWLKFIREYPDLIAPNQ